YCLTYACCALPLVFRGAATAETDTLSLHDALPICELQRALAAGMPAEDIVFSGVGKQHWELVRALDAGIGQFNLESEEEGEELRSEEHTSELQSRENLVCRLLLEKKKKREAKTAEK